MGELGLMALAGLFMGALGPFGTGAFPPVRRYLYWLACIVGGGAIGIVLDETLGRRAGGLWRRMGVDAVLMTAPVTGLVLAVSTLLVGAARGPGRPVLLAAQVFVVSAAVMGLRALVWRRPRTLIRTHTIVSAPLPGAEAAFRRRLSARRRTARLIAIEAHDHYLKVHTDAGAELVTARFSDALTELAGAQGFRTHRSWWVFAEAIEQVRWRRGAGEARLAGGLKVPVSRRYGAALKAAGWL